MEKSPTARISERSLVLAIILLASMLVSSVSEAEPIARDEVVEQILNSYRVQAVASPDGHYIAIENHDFVPEVKDLPQTVLGLAGWRVNAATGAFIGVLNSDLFEQAMIWDASARRKVAMPAVPNHLGIPLWSPDGRQFAVMHASDKDVQLWIGDVEARTVRQMPNVRLNAAHAGVLPDEGVHLPCSWTKDSRSLLCFLRPATLKLHDEWLLFPTIHNSYGAEKALSYRRSFQQNLRRIGDVAYYDYYMSAQPAFIDVTSGSVQAMGPVAVYRQLQLSPNGEYLIATRIEKPYSYELMDTRFPSVTEVWDRSGRVVREIGRSGLDTSADPKLGNAAAAPRLFFWQPTAPATVVFFQALDSGAADKKASFRIAYDS